MIFTSHAVERYRQFHMLDQPTATNDESRTLLELHAGTAINLGRRTNRGDQVWAIEALGIDLVVKHEDGEVIAVTVLPPQRFRGLTPLQAEAVADSIVLAKALVVEVERERATVSASSPATPPVTMVERREAGERAQKLSTLKKRHHGAVIEHDLLAGLLKTMRTQLTADRNHANTKAALKIAVRCLRSIPDSRAADALADIEEIDPGLVSVRFAYGDDVGADK